MTGLKERLIRIAIEAGLDYHGNRDDEEFVARQFKTFVGHHQGKATQSADWPGEWTKWINHSVEYRNERERDREKERERRDDRDRERKPKYPGRGMMP